MLQDVVKDRLSFDVNRPKAIYQQIRDHVRELIKSGSLAPGDRLPPTSDLAVRWNTHAASIHAALNPLVKEGLLSRRPRIGTFVTARRNRLSEISIYYDADIWNHHASAFKRAVHIHLAELLGKKGIDVRVWVDPRGGRGRSAPWDALTAAAERRVAQAIIATDVPEEVIGWIDELPVPAAFFSNTAAVKNRVCLDFQQFASASAKLLKKQGCRSAGVISILEDRNGDAVRTNGECDFQGQFIAACRELGLEVRSEWLRMAERFVPDESQEDFGYVEFGRIWSQAKRPDGLVVFPDTSLPGVVTAVLEKQVRVPADLKIIAHKHAEISILCPLPVTYLYSSARQIAEALFYQVQRQLEGNACTPIVLPFQLRATFKSSDWSGKTARANRNGNS